jgi:hypothetical protein
MDNNFLVLCKIIITALGNGVNDLEALFPKPCDERQT